MILFDLTAVFLLFLFVFSFANPDYQKYEEEQPCGDNTQGEHCERCSDGYFGHPVNGGQCSRWALGFKYLTTISQIFSHSL